MNTTPLSKRGSLVLDYLRSGNHGKKTNVQMATDLAVSKSTVNGALSELNARNLVCIDRIDPHPVSNPTGRDIYTRPRLLDELDLLHFESGDVDWYSVVCAATHRLAFDGCHNCNRGDGSSEPKQSELRSVADLLVIDGDLNDDAVAAFVHLAITWDKALPGLVVVCNASRLAQLA